MGQHTHIESVEALIKAVQYYIEELRTNKAILINAANACDAAMGDDDLAKKHIARLNTALEELDRTEQIAEAVVQSLVEDRALAISIYEEA